MSPPFRKCGLYVCILASLFRCPFIQIVSSDKEVLGYFDDGLDPPDDITLLFTDDKFVEYMLHCNSVLTDGAYSWGNMVRLPLPDAFNRTGGAGVYYHVSKGKNVFELF